MLRVQVAGYEFELETLILALRARINIREIRISTVYERRNPSSHFNSVLDSMKIYFVFIRFVSASLASFFLDTAVFSISFFLTGQIFLSMIIGRIVNGTFNFLSVKMIVFQSKENLLRETVKYISLGRNTYACIIRANQVTCDIRRNKPLYCKDIDGDDPVFRKFFYTEESYLSRGTSRAY
ncbi:MAG: hypothetical protein ACUVQ2_05405 [Dissulfurimicrobium sp.]|uniref:hypothetical protein n=1 Tax=Dissulfurimicrobium sp. TaxID=2022436 RepID=UPI00404A829E